MVFPQHIFKAYDIRGLVKEDLSEDLAYRLGRAFVRLLKQEGTELTDRKIVIAKDMRPSSPLFAEQVIRGINDEGVDVVDIGMSSSPVFNFACADVSDFAGGIIVTASHNPAEYNGFKILRESGLSVGKGTGMEELQEMVASADMTEIAEKRGSLETQSLLARYIEKIFSLVPKEDISPMHIVIDAGNGMAKTSFPVWLKELPITVDYLYLEPDGTFPNHEANPLKTETLKDLQAAVIEKGADFGFALDGDADRIGLVNEKGDVVPASFVGALIGQEYLRDHGSMHMLYDLRSSSVLKDVYDSHNATSEMCMVGSTKIKKMMQDVNAGFASELSLHLFFKSMHYLESPDLCLLYILRLLSKEQKLLSELITPLETYVHSGEMNFEVEDPATVLSHVEDALKEEALEVSHLDGVWMKFEWGWVSLRKSNTEPLIRLNLETPNLEMTKEKVTMMKELINNA